MSDLDLVVFGATGFVGALVAEHLARVAPDGARIGLAGRSKEKLERVRDELARDWPLLVVDAREPDELVDSARVVCTTVGPYARYGRPLVEACARSGTHYLDLTGEVVFVREVIDDLHEVAAASGAKVVPSCGYDSIPSDLAVLLLSELVHADVAGDLEETTLVASLKGGVSGGTIDSLRVHAATVKARPELRALVDDPYALSPARAAEPRLAERPDRARVRKDAEGRWTGPFVMAQYNTRVVRRSNALLDYAYGRGLRYQEQMSFGRGPLAPVLAGAAVTVLPLAEPAMAFGPTRSLLDRVLPKPGSGPSEQARRTGWFRMDVEATTSTGATYHAVVAGQGDPGYAATAVMMGESALSLAFDDLPERAGVLTPATAMGHALVDRLRVQGMELSVARR
ncbi:MAG TPA: saccharopine dehydrogenase NADP-binding domain-containing protein [Mycobacteriales bacterium]|nr:saccharopine dehydrogenase NADP-binding domain-containing protein [Mycobacteriales bacterium]